MEAPPSNNHAANREEPTIPTKGLNRQTAEVGEACGTLTYDQRMRPLWLTYRNILLVVLLIFVFALVQTFTLWQVCNTGMTTAASLKQQGLPTLNGLASLQEDLAIYRLNAYEHLFAREGEKSEKAKSLQDISARTRAELRNIKILLPDGESGRLASNLENAFADLDTEFGKVQKLEDSDFVEAMREMDQNIPGLTAQVNAAANAFSHYGYHFSGEQANATIESFGWIKKNASLFGSANIVVAFGAVLFVLLAARRSRAQLSQTLAQVEERTRELAQSLSRLNATLESTADGILVVDGQMRVTNYNSKFAEMWRLPVGLLASGKEDQILPLAVEQVKDGPAFLAKVRELYEKREARSHDILELKDGRVFERDTQPQRLNGQSVGRVWSFRDISDRQQEALKLEKINKQLVEVSRRSGMAEIATNVLHNVGNILNSVNVSSGLVAENLRKSKAPNLSKAVALMREHTEDLGTFLSSDAKGKQLPDYLAQLAEHLTDEQDAALKELVGLQKNIEHIKEIVAMQQSYARVSGVTEIINVRELVEDSLRMSEEALNRHRIELVCQFEEVPPINIEKHKILQILVNLIRNAKHACQDSERPDKRVTVRVANGDGQIKISVGDNGVGISSENLTRIFNHGFTTKKDGHGYGLHSGALAAKELSGILRVDSEGSGQGATFTLELPLQPTSSVSPATK